MDSVAPTPDAAVRPTPTALREIMAVVIVLAVLAASAAAFAVPYVRRAAVLEDPLQSLLGLEQGRASLFRVTDPAGSTVAWQSESLRVVPGVTAIASTEATFRGTINGYIDPDEGNPSLEDLDQFQLQRESVIRISTGDDGAEEVTRSEELTMLGPEGLVLFGSTDRGAGGRVYDPPWLLVPHEPTLGMTWSGSGTATGNVTYKLTGEVVDRGEATAPVGAFDDCLTTRLHVVQVAGDVGATAEHTIENVWCDGVGRVSGEVSGDQQERSVLVSDAKLGGLPTSLIPDHDSRAPADRTPDPAAWVLGRAGRIGDASNTSQSTSSAPVWIGGATPALLVNEESSGDLVAVDAGDDLGRVQWRFHPRGRSYGEPAHDATRGRLYFGAGDKRVYALDDRGAFLWAAATGDNVVATPAIAGDLVIAAGEDGVVRALDSDTGEEQWTVQTDDSIVAAPAVVDGVAVVGSDDGLVRGIDVPTGAVLWTHEASGPVQADIVATDTGSVIVAADGGDITELDVRGGTPRWESFVGGDVRVAPAVTEDEVFVVDSDVDLTALSRTDGSRRWVERGREFRGSPVVVGDSVIVQESDGAVLRFGMDGDVLAEYDANDSVVAGDGLPQFSVSPTLGSGAMWLVADDTTIFRLGDASRETSTIETRWLDQIAEPPFAGAFVITTPVAWGKSILAVDTSLGVVQLDPTTGTGELLGTIEAPEDSFPVVPPAVVGDVLVADLGIVQLGVSLPGLEILWSKAATDASLSPPIVAGDTVLLTEAGDLFAVNPATGDEVWRVAAGESTSGSSPTLDGGVVYAGSPLGAWDAGSGRLRWTSAVDDPIGGAATRDGIVIVASNHDGPVSGTLSGLDAETGEQLWVVDVGEEVQNPLGSLAIAGSLVVVDTDQIMAGYDVATGERRWRSELSDATAGTLTVDDGLVLKALVTSQVVAIDASSGDVVATFAGFGRDLASFAVAQHPMVVSGTMIVPMAYGLVGFEPVRR